MINRILRLFPYVKRLENDKAKALAGEISLVDLLIKDGKMDATFKTEFAKILCAWCVDVMGDAPNYVEISLSSVDSDGEKYTVTVQKNSGKTPHELRQIAEQKVADLIEEKFCDAKSKVTSPL